MLTLLTQRPPSVGKSIPKDAFYVGRYGNRYAWVTAEGVPGLSRFPVVVLGAVKLEPGPSPPRSRGLAFTPR